jgi:hypothetical protein
LKGPRAAGAALGLTALSLAVVLAGIVGGRFADAALAVAAGAFPPLLLGGWATSRSRPGLLAVVIGGLALVIVVSSSAIAWLSGSARAAGGLPAAAWWMLGGLVLAPLVLTAWGHAASFDEPPDPRGGA